MVLKSLRFLSIVWLAGCSNTEPLPKTGAITTLTSDGVTVYGELYFGELDDSAPLVLLFHQGRSNGRGEYAEIAAWLNASGYRTIAWDQRAGGAGQAGAAVGAATDRAPVGRR